MKKIASILAFGAAVTLTASAQPSLTIYNQNFAVVRDTVPLDLKSGVNEVRFAGATALVEADSVILRDAAGKRQLQILEQNYRNDPVSQEFLLFLNEGKTIDFQNIRMKDNTAVREIIPGTIVRSGYDNTGPDKESPIIEVDGKLQFSLPGQPLFPSLGDDTILKPAFNWLLKTDQPGEFDAEVGYITGGFSWEASYNLVAPEKGEFVDIIGWITMNNHSGTTFRDAKIKLMAGDVQKIQPPAPRRGLEVFAMKSMEMEDMVTEKSFDEFHLYTLARPTTLRDRETKQVEFVRAERVKAPVIYVYDGAANIRFYGGLNYDRGFGPGESNKKVAVTREFVNAETNNLGIALPAGKLRFYRSNDDRQLEFTGEDRIDHTPRNETVRVTTGNAFDLVGERKQTDFRVDTGDKWMEETFEIKLRNRKTEPVSIRVVERLYRWSNWKVTTNTADFIKKDSQTIEFNVPVKPDEEKVITYTVRYSW